MTDAGRRRWIAGRWLRTLSQAVIYRLGCAAARFLPRRLLLPVFLWLGSLAYRLNTPRTRVLRETLRTVQAELGERDLEAMVLAGCRSRSRYWYEYLAVPSMTIEQIHDRTHVEGLHHLIEAAGVGRGVVVGSLHSRNWDFTMACIADALALPVDVPCGTFVDRPVLDWVIRDRKRHGLHYLPPMDARGERFEEMRRRIERGGVAIVVTDFSESQVGCEVRLLGGQAFISSGAAALAVATGAPLLSLVSWYDANGRVQAVIGPDIPVETGVSGEVATSELAQALADRFSEAIARHPEDWHAALGQANGFDPRAAVISPQRGEARRAAR